MNQNIRTFLGELYEIDPEFQKYEQELIPLVEDLLSLKKDASPSPAFVQELRMKLHDRADQKMSSSFLSFLPFSLMSKYSFALTGALIAVVATGPLFYGLGGGELPFTKEEPSGTPLFSYEVTETGPKAFGELADGTAGTMTRDQSGGGGGMGMGGGAAISATPPAAPIPAATTADVDEAATNAAVPETDAKMIAPGPDYPWTVYDYVYEGEPIELTDDSVGVLKRKLAATLPSASRFIESFNFGLMDLDTFSNVGLDSFSVSQKGQNALTIFVNLIEESLSINQNWSTWNHPESRCTTEACYQQYRIKASDMPADDVVFGIVDDFIKAHNINMEAYGEPRIDKYWLQQPAGSDIYYPEILNVVYPFNIDDQLVSDDSGNSVGLNIGVHVKERKVASVWNLMSQSYEKSDYPAVKDSAKVLEFLKRTDNYYTDIPEEQAVNRVTVKLGTPTKTLLQYYKYDPARSTSENLLVPALLFPVIEKPANEPYFWRKAVAVPLAQELFDERMNQQYPVLY